MFVFLKCLIELHRKEELELNMLIEGLEGTAKPEDHDGPRRAAARR